MNLSVVLRGYEMWFHVLREEHRMLYANIIMMTLFGSKRKEVTGALR